LHYVFYSKDSKHLRERPWILTFNHSLIIQKTTGIEHLKYV